MPRKKVILAGDKIDFLFRCQTKADTRDGKLLRYLCSNDTELPLREMLLVAAAAFWMPFAHKHHNDLPPEELEQCVSRAIYQLQTQIIYLEESFGSRRIGKQNFNDLIGTLPASSIKQNSYNESPQYEMYPDTTQTVFDAPPTTQEGTSRIEKVFPSSSDPNSDSTNEVAIPTDVSGVGEWQDLDF